MTKVICPALSILMWLSTTLVFSGETAKIEGFRDLKWGTTLEEAIKIYPDLTFNPKAEEYFRENEDKKIGDVEVDRIEYSFKDNKFFRVIARISGTKREEYKRVLSGFMTLKNNIEAKYGMGVHKEERRRLPGIVKHEKLEWIVGDSKINLSELELMLDKYILDAVLVIENISAGSKLGF